MIQEQQQTFEFETKENDKMQGLQVETTEENNPNLINTQKKKKV